MEDKGIYIKILNISGKNLWLIKCKAYKNLLFIGTDINLLGVEIDDLLLIVRKKYEKKFHVTLKKFIPAPFAINLKDSDKYDTLLFIYKEEDLEFEPAKPKPTQKEIIDIIELEHEQLENNKEQVKRLKDVIGKLQKSKILTSR